MAEVEYTVTFQLDVTSTRRVKFDPAGMTREEVTSRAVAEAGAKNQSVGNVLGALSVSAQGEEIWGGKEGAQLLGAGDIGDLLGVKQRTVYEWMRRYPGLTPAPDYVKPVLLWWSWRVSEWLAWRADPPGPGQGVGGGRPPKENSTA